MIVRLLSILFQFSLEDRAKQNSHVFSFINHFRVGTVWMHRGIVTPSLASVCVSLSNAASLSN